MTDPEPGIHLIQVMTEADTSLHQRSEHSEVDLRLKIKVLWEAMMTVVSVVAVVEFPLRLFYHYPESWFIVFFELAVSILFFADMMFHLLFPDKKKGRRRMKSRKEERKEYFRFWFWADLFSTIPTGLIVSWYPFGGVNRLLRIIHMVRFWRHIRELNVFNPSLLRLINLVFWILLVDHFISCGWLFLDTDLHTMEPLHAYAQAFHLTIASMSTVGYGKVSPSTPVELVYVVLIGLAGAGLYGFIIGNIASLIANLDKSKVAHREKMEKINTFMKYRNLPLSLQHRINDYFDYLWTSRRGHDEAEILAELPTPLKIDVSLYLNKEIIQKVPIFKGASESFIREIILNLYPQVFTPGDFIFRKGDVGGTMYFISRGTVEVVSEGGGTVYATLSEGSFFGEIALLLQSPRTASIRAADYCDLYVLDKRTFDSILQRFPEFESHIRELAQKRKLEMESGS